MLCSGQTMNYHRPKGPPRYAAPPPGMYGSPPSVASTLPPPTSSIPGPLPPQGPSIPPQMLVQTSYMSNPIPGPPPPPLNVQQSSSHVNMDANIPMMPQSSVEVPLQGSHSAPYVTYIPVQYHWFYMKHVGLKQTWIAFSIMDSNNLEQAFRSGYCFASTHTSLFVLLVLH